MFCIQTKQTAFNVLSRELVRWFCFLWTESEWLFLSSRSSLCAKPTNCWQVVLILLSKCQDGNCKIEYFQNVLTRRNLLGFPFPFHSPASSAHWSPLFLARFRPLTLRLVPLPVVFDHHCEPQQKGLHRTWTAKTDGEESVHLWKFGGTKNIGVLVEDGALLFGQLSALWQRSRAIRAFHTRWWLNLSLCTPHSWLDGTSAVQMSNMRVHRCVGVSQQSPLMF